MRRGRAPLPHLATTAVLAALTAWATTWSWAGLTTDAGEFVGPLLLLGILVAAIGILGRWSGTPVALVVLVQLLAVSLGVLGVVTGTAWPTDEALGSFRTAWGAALDSARTFAAPVPRDVPPIHPLLLAGGALVLVATDLLVGGLRRTPVAGLVLLGAYSLPGSLVGRGVSWWVFVAVAAGFLLLLFLQHDDQLSRWGRTMDQPADAADPTGFSVRTGAIRGSALALGSTATTLALVLPLLVPTFEIDLFDGPGTGDGDLQVADPMVDLRRDLQRGEDLPLLWVTTEQRPTYLRLSVLTRFNGDAWTPGDRDIPDTQGARGDLPALEGVAASVDREEVPYFVRVSGDFESAWLPTMAPISRIEAGPTWRYDTSTMDFLSSDEETTAAGEIYTMTGVRLQHDAAAMDATASAKARVRSIFTEVPPSLPSEVRSLAAAVTGDAPSLFRKARALQQWFREDGGFTYDLSAVESLGSSNEELLAFLREGGRRGYCEQFAAAMALMARTLGIPARVAVGFLAPEATAEDTWEFSAWDLHAWPELYFPGSGWVRFEPTPSSRAPGVPGYTRAEIDDRGAAEPTPSGALSSEELPDRGEGPAPEAAAAADGSGGFPWGLAAAVVVVLALVVALALLPWLLRRTRRERRRHSGAVEDAWTELRDLATDLGHRWPRGRSPRAAAAWLRLLLGDPEAEPTQRPARGVGVAPESEAALDRLLALLERARYARDGVGAPGAAVTWADVESVTAALVAGVSPGAARRATWWPRSVLSSRKRTAVEVARRSGPAVSGVGVVDHVG